MTTFEFNSVDFLIEFCLNEIGLDGLEGCSLTDLFPRLHKSSRTMTSTQSASSLSSLEQINRIFSSIIDNEQQENNAYKNFIWRLLKSRNELRFYIKRSGTGSSSNPAVSSAPSKGKKKSNFQPYNIDETKMINHNGDRGFSETYFKRTCVNGLFKDEGGEHFSKTFEECLNEFGSNLIIVADQTVRDKVLCPAFKNLVFENLNDLEYCVLEAIAKSRYEGSTTIGDEGLSSRFNVAPKQLHYILVNLESNGLIKRQVVASEKTRSLVHLTRFALKKKNLMETVCDYLLAIGQRSSGGSTTNHEACADTFTNIRMNLGLTQKKFKNLIPIAERANIMQRYTGAAPVLTKSSSNKEQVAKPRPVRMVRLTSEFFKSHMTSGGVMSSSGGIGSTNGEEETEEADDDQTSLSSLRRTLGSAQSHNLPLYALMFAKIEQFAKDGVSLKQIGTMFALDFYKSRRMGNNLQAHPEIVTIMKETNKGKTKFQTIVMRKFLALTSKSESVETKSSQEEGSSAQNKETIENKTNESETSREQTSEGPPTQPTESDQLLILKREGQPNQSIQALISNRMLNRKKLIIDYLDKHRICTKYDLTREIRTRESAQSLPGSIDAKTTKRMLLALERDKKLHTFEVALKNVSYMCVRAYDIDESDEIYKNYCCTFKRTYDSVDLKSTTAKSGGDETTTTTSRDEDLDTSNNNADDDLALRSSTKLTNSFIESVVADLEVLPHRKKLFIVVPKFQKTIILHRFIHYLLFFYDGVQQSTESKEIEEVETDRCQLSTADIEMMDSCKLPRLNEAYQPITIDKNKKDEEEEEDEDMRETGSGSLSWSTFVPPLERTQFPLTDSTGCIFVREIFSCMPLSIFCNLVGIQYVVPGLVPLLKHPQKRHMLVRSLPPRLVAPLLHHRRYLHRLYEILQLMACLGLVTFVDSPCKSIQPVNRDIHSQMVYVHRKVRFYDTSTNRCRDWDSLARLNKANFALYDDSNKSTEELAENEQYERCEVDFNTPEDVVNYWRKLLHISMNTYKFSALKYMHERSGSGDRLTKSVCKSRRVEEIEPVWPIEKHGDHMGPGGYDSQLFLSSFKNWTISIGRSTRSSTNRTSDTTTTANTTRTRSGRSSTPSAAVAAASSEEPAITKDADLSTAPCSELALIFPFGVFRGIATNEQPTTTTTTTSPASNSAKSAASKKSRAAATKRKRTETEESPESEVEEPPTKTATTPQPQAKKQKKLASVKLQKAKYLLDKAAKNKQAALVKQQQQQQPILDDRRATWNAAEDELILLIKCAHMYFLPNERSVPFKLINDVSNRMIPPTPGLEKKVSSFGRRIKMLLKWKANLIYVTNKLELCRQDKQLEAKYGEERAKLRKKSPNDREPTDLYVRFIRDVKERFLKKKSYSGALTDDVVEQEVGDDDDATKKIDLPDSMDEFRKKYRILNTQQREMLFKPQSAHFKQPTTDYEITCNTVQSAIHSSILINDKNPRVFESFNLFDKYSDQLLTDVIQKMSRQHKIIAPTKCSELKKKNVTAFSKHIGKAYHISQRYQFKWVNVMASSVLNETKKFKDDLVAFKIDQMKKSASHSHHHHHDEEMFDCTDKDDIGMTSFLAHTIDNADLQVQIDVPNKIWVSKLI